jgi:hypothetical protein
MAAPINKYLGTASGFIVQPGGFKQRCDSLGKVWTVTVRCRTNEWSDGPVRFSTAASLGISGIDSAYVLDDYDSNTLVGQEVASTTVEGLVEATLNFRQPANMADNPDGEDPLPVYTCTWRLNEVALAAFTLDTTSGGFGGRYTTFGTNITISSQVKTLWAVAQDWLNADSASVRSGILAGVVANGTGSQVQQFKDFLYWHTQGVESVELFLPVLTRTQTTDSAPTATASPGSIEVPPEAFGDLLPANFTWRRMGDEVTRVGRTGAYNATSQWVGDRKWQPAFYGTPAEQSGTGAGIWKSFS